MLYITIFSQICTVLQVTHHDTFMTAVAVVIIDRSNKIVNRSQYQLIQLQLLLLIHQTTFSGVAYNKFIGKSLESCFVPKTRTQMYSTPAHTSVDWMLTRIAQ